jgi:hypothetical protein
LPAARAYNPVAYLRQFATLADAVRKWAVEKPDRPLLNLVQQCSEDATVRERRLEEIKRRKKECATEILEALGQRQDFVAAAKTMDDWCAAARTEACLTLRDGALRPKFIPLMNTVWEITCTLRPLLESYRDPDRFLREIAPSRWPTDLLLSSKEDLALMWGLGTRSYREGRRRGTRDRPDAPRHVSHEERLKVVDLGEKKVRALREERFVPVRGSRGRSLRYRAEAERVSVAAIRKSVTIARKRRSEKSPE